METGLRYRAGCLPYCDDATPSLITDVTTTLATTADNTMPCQIQQQLVARGLAPAEQLVDAGYVSADNLVKSLQAGIDLVGPPPPEPGWRAKAGAGFAGSYFVLDWDQQVATCPQGHTSTRWTATQDHEGRASVAIRFAAATCAACPVRVQCLGHAGTARSLLVHERAHYEALRTARARQGSAAYQAVYAERAGIDGTISQGVRISDLRRTRYIGLAKTRLMHFLVAAALYFIRVAAWLAEVPRAQTQPSAFAALARTPS